MGTVEYPSWSSICRSSTQFNLAKTRGIFEFEEAISKSDTATFIATFLCCIWGLIFSLLSIAKRLLELKTKISYGVTFYPDYMIEAGDNPNITANQLKLSFRCEMIIFVLLLLFSLGLLINVGVYYHFTSTTEKWMRDSLRCMGPSDYFREWVQEGYLEVLQSAVRKCLICIICGIIITCLDCIYLMWRFNKGDLAAQNVTNLFFDDNESDGEISDKNDLQHEEQYKEEYFPEKEVDDENDFDFMERKNTQAIEIGQVSPTIGTDVLSNRNKTMKSFNRSQKGRTRPK